MSFFDREYGTISPLPNERSVNGLLFLVTFIYLRMINKDSLEPHTTNAFQAIHKMYDRRVGLFSKNPWHGIEKEIASHDDFTAAISFLRKFKLDNSFFIEDEANLDPYLKYFWRDPIYYWAARGKWWSIIFLPILSVTMIFSCRPYKAPNGLPDTDGKILAWIRLNTIKVPLTWKICTWLINREFGNWGKVFMTYHRVEGHPIRELAEEMIYSNSKWSLLY